MIFDVIHHPTYPRNENNFLEQASRQFRLTANTHYNIFQTKQAQMFARRQYGGYMQESLHLPLIARQDYGRSFGAAHNSRNDRTLWTDQNNFARGRPRTYKENRGIHHGGGVFDYGLNQGTDGSSKSGIVVLCLIFVFIWFFLVILFGKR